MIRFHDQFSLIVNSLLPGVQLHAISLWLVLRLNLYAVYVL